MDYEAGRGQFKIILALYGLLRYLLSTHCCIGSFPLSTDGSDFFQTMYSHKGLRVIR